MAAAPTGANAPFKNDGAASNQGPEQIAEIKKRAAKSKELQASFGEIVGLLMRSPQYKNMPLYGLEQLVVPAITNGQFMVAQAQEKKSGITAPVAAVLWANVSEEIDQRLSDNRGEPVQLAPKDWKSGNIPWLIVAAGDQRLIKGIKQRIEEVALSGRPLKSRSVDKEANSVASPPPLD